MYNDTRIKRDVEEEFASEAGLDPSLINVTVKNGMVLLSGQVMSFSDKLVAERAAIRVAGDESVKSTLRVELPVTAQRSDRDIYSSCKAALFESYGVPRGVIEPIVEKGHV